MEGYEYPTKPVAKESQVVKGDNWRITVLTEGLVRCEWAEDGQFEDRASTFAINRDLPAAKFRSFDLNDNVHIVTDRFHLTYDKKRFTQNGLCIDVVGKVLDGQCRWWFGDWNTSLGGTARTLDDVDGRCELGPGVLSREGFAAIDDKHSMLLDGKNWVAGRRAGDREDFYVFLYALDFKPAMQAFFALSGKQEEVPRFAFGNWWSRFHQYSDKEYLKLMDDFKKEDVPMSVAVIDMDWHWYQHERVSHRGWTGYSWNTELFPDPKDFLANLRSRDLKTTLNDHPADGVHAFEDVYEQMAKEMGFDTSNKDPIPFDCVNPAFLKAYLNMFRSLGVDFDWIDWQQGTASAIPGVDPLWVLNHFHYLDNKKINSTPMIFSRYAGPGSHRYPIGFSGDTWITWESLKFQPEFTATASNIGFGWWSHDIGGHMFAERSDEMATRWVQFGCFSPFLRLHSTQSRWMSKEPWRYHAEARSAINNMLRFRHRLIPYLHTMNIRCHRENEPLIQPVYWHYSDRDEAYSQKNSYYFGTELFVVPITSPRSNVTRLGSEQAWLPPGPRRWVDVFSGTAYDADRAHTFYRQLDQIPVLAPEGTILPLDANQRPKNGTHNPAALELLLIPGVNASFTLLENSADDAGSENKKGEERSVDFSWDQAARTLRIKSQGPELKRPIKLTLVGTASPASFDIEGTEFTVPEKHTVELGRPPLPERLEPLIESFQTEFAKKQELWEKATESTAPLLQRVSAILQLNLHEDLAGPVLEHMLSDLDEGQRQAQADKESKQALDELRYKR